MDEKNKIREDILNDLADKLSLKALKNLDLLEKIIAIADAMGIQVDDVRKFMNEEKDFIGFEDY